MFCFNIIGGRYLHSKILLMQPKKLHRKMADDVWSANSIAFCFCAVPIRLCHCAIVPVVKSPLYVHNALNNSPSFL